MRAEVSGSGVASAAFRYRAYGQMAAATASSPTYLGYASLLTDPSGLIYARARWYDPASGRFLSRDPNNGDPDLPATLNSYLYAAADPILMLDPSGLAFTTDEGGACDLECQKPDVKSDGVLGALAHVVGAVTTAVEAAGSLEERASAIGKALRTAEETAVRSAAAKLLPQAGKIAAFTKTPLFKALGRLVLPLGWAANVAGHLAEGSGLGPALVRGTIETGGALAGGLAGGLACAAVAAPSGGAGLVLCPVLVAGGGWAGEQLASGVGAAASNAIFGGE